jgi:hypothetical protein
MTSHDPQRPDGNASVQTYALLGEAAGQLRTFTDDRWVEVSSRVLASALSASRRSLPLRATAPGGLVQVSQQVVVAYLRAAIDDAVPGAAVARITVDIADRDRFAGVVIELIPRYGAPILPVADRVRDLAAGVLVDLLGTDAPSVYVRSAHVHVSDVTVGDPQVTDPATGAPACS